MPLAYQPWEGRYDDPDRTWRTLYVATDAYGAWVEVLGRFRPHDDLMAALKDITDEDGDPAPIPEGRLPIVAVPPPGRPCPHHGRFADVGDPDTRAGSLNACPKSSFGAACVTSTCPPPPARSVS